ncbi:acyltransferase family protein [Klugiella xanthotipulae]|uniref:Peptidoglycan/LPS O-acetylase OafA/YrhL n=1 Tax=Klugiella xanthotipulae TaxID=244735 RepID=A0A543I572_9MICO|nr:acyltransferase family protein [Klugiella xanthotipulae]TQM65738.1 peptidoglycan/LPS O-acetylase OafA/YrhL [Klugiella xanthotipulae]
MIHHTFPAVATVPTGAVGAATTRRYNGLDGLRALAVSLVLVYHLTPGVLRGGFIGVDIFFVVSGFLITSLLLREHAVHGRISLRGFWQRRARRLLPALALVTLTCSSLGALVGGDTLVNLSNQLLGAATFSSNWVYIIDDSSYFARDTPDLFRNLWSLAVEEQFYILWPLAVILLLAVAHSRRQRVVTVATFALASAALMAFYYVPGEDPTRAYFGSDSHSFGLAIGAALAFLATRTQPGRTSDQRPSSALLARPVTVYGVALFSTLALFAGAVWLQEQGGFTYRGGIVLVSLATAALIWAVTNHTTALGRFVDIRPLRYIGERSYGLYLWHWPLWVLLQSATHTLDRAHWNPWLTGVLALALTAICAHLSYRFVEQPIRRLGLRGAAVAAWHSVGGTGIRSVTASTVAALLVLTASGSTSAIMSSTSTNSATTNIERGQTAVNNADLEGAAPDGISPSATAPGPGSAGNTPPGVPPPQHPLPTGDHISAVGDSVMLASAPELQAAFPGITVDAAVSRSMRSGAEIVTRMATEGTLRNVLIVGLGTNGPISDESLEAIRVAANGRPLVLVNAFGPRSWIPEVNAQLTAFAARYRNVDVANWNETISGSVNFLAGDQIHPGAQGASLYTSSVQAALQRLADLPPLRDSTGYGLAGPPS